MLNVKLQILEEGKLPIKAHNNDAAYDVFVREIEKGAYGLMICYLGIKTEIPDGYRGIVVARSGITKYGWFMPNGFGVIDPAYRGEWQARFLPALSIGETNERNTSLLKCNDVIYRQFPYSVGDRVAQIYFEKETRTALNIVNSLSDSVRGEKGFHSTGH